MRCDRSRKKKDREAIGSKWKRRIKGMLFFDWHFPISNNKLKLQVSIAHPPRDLLLPIRERSHAEAMRPCARASISPGSKENSPPTAVVIAVRSKKTRPAAYEMAVGRIRRTHFSLFRVLYIHGAFPYSSHMARSALWLFYFFVILPCSPADVCYNVHGWTFFVCVFW